MRIINQSRLPDAEVAELVRFAFRGIRDTGIVVKVKNTRSGAYRGMAYHGVPTMSPEVHKATAQRLVTIGIGADSRFPTSNVAERSRTVRTITVSPDVCPLGSGSAVAYGLAREAGPLAEGESFGGVRFPREGGAIVSVVRIERTPYGGKGSPEITVHDWREALVAVAAHEARHIWQFQQRDAGKRKRLGEVDAERHAAKRLDEYRSMESKRRAVAAGR